MSQYMPNAQTWPAPVGFSLTADDLSGVRTRRICAVALDLLVVMFLSAVIFVVLTVVTFGLSLFLLPPLFPIVAFLYNGLTVSGHRMATPGMRAFDLEVRMADSGARVPFLHAAVQAVLFYVSWLFPPVLLVSLVNRSKRCLHDIFSGVIVTRRR